MVINDKCYFYSEPGFEYQKKAYLVKNDIGYFTQVENGFVFVTFTNPNGRTTQGWINTMDIQILNQ